MSPVLAIASKDLRLLKRDRMNFFFTFVFPLIYGVFFGFMYTGSGPRGVTMIVVDEDGTARSAAFVSVLSKTEGLKVTPAATREAGKDLVRTGKAAACVVVPKGYAEAAGKIFTGTAAELVVFIDPSRRAESGLLQGRLAEVSFRQLADTFTNLSVLNDALDQGRRSVASAETLTPESKSVFNRFFDEASALSAQLNRNDAVVGPEGAEAGAGAGGFSPVKITVEEIAKQTDGPRTAFDISLPQGAAWGLMGAVMAFGLSLVQERGQGTLVRLTAAPIGPLQILMGKALACFVTALLVQVMLIAVAVAAFGVRIGAPVSLTMAVLASAVGFSGVMAVLAVVGRTEGGAGGAGRAVLLLLTIFGGGAIPLVFMPEWMRTASGISPFKWSIVALEGGIWRGYSVGEMLMPCGILLAVGVAGLLAGAVLFKRLQG